MTDGYHHIHVWRMSTNELWEIPHRPNHAFGHILAVSPTEIVFMASETVPAYKAASPVSLFRVELASIPQIVAKKWVF